MTRFFAVFSGFTFFFPTLMTADEITVTPTVIEVGQGAEGLALIGEALWVAEGNARALGKYTVATGTLIERVAVGQAPVHLATAGETFFATIPGNKKIWQEGPDGPGKVVGETGSDVPAAIVADAAAIYVLLHLNGSNADTAVMRLDPASGTTTRSSSLGANATALAVTGDHLWVISNPVVNGQAEGTLTRLNPETLDLIEQLPVGGRLLNLAQSDGLLFVGGGEEEAGTLVSIDGESGEMFGFADCDGSSIAALATDDELVISVDRKGVIQVHDQATLIPQRTIHLDLPPFTPRDILVTPEAIFISARRGETGVIYRIDDWKPLTILTETPAATLFRTEAIGGVSLGLNENEMEVHLGKPEQWGEERENESDGGFFIEAIYPAKGIAVLLFAVDKGDARTVESVRVSGKSELGTAAGIRLGASLAEVRQAYEAFEDKSTSPDPTATAKKDTFRAGSGGDGLLFEFEDGKVSSIYLGHGVE